MQHPVPWEVFKYLFCQFVSSTRHYDTSEEDEIWFLHFPFAKFIWSSVGKKPLTCAGLWNEIAGYGVQKGSTKHTVVVFLQVYFRQWQSKTALLCYCLYGKIHGEVRVKVWCISYEEQATEPVLLKCQARALVTLKIGHILPSPPKCMTWRLCDIEYMT